jgi:H+/gluconate symporter-like permease
VGLWWLYRRKNVLTTKGEGYGDHTLNEPEIRENEHLPNFWLSLVPLVLVLGLNDKLTDVLPVFYSAEELKKYGISDVNKVLGVWALIPSLIAGILFALGIWLLNKRAGKGGETSAEAKTGGRFADALMSGVMGSLLAIMNTASEVGFGNVVATLPGFKAVADFLLNMKTNPLVSEALSINILAGITGSASGGMSIALDTMGAKYLAWATSVGVDPELLHRIASMSAGGMDTLPHNGAVITLLAICGLTHRQSYPDIFAITVIKTLAVPLVIAVALTTGLV